LRQNDGTHIGIYILNIVFDLAEILPMQNIAGQKRIAGRELKAESKKPKAVKG
jgi:hypothetical protein